MDPDAGLIRQLLVASKAIATAAAKSTWRGAAARFPKITPTRRLLALPALQDLEQQKPRDPQSHLLFFWQIAEQVRAISFDVPPAGKSGPGKTWPHALGAKHAPLPSPPQRSNSAATTPAKRPPANGASEDIGFYYFNVRKR